MKSCLPRSKPSLLPRSEPSQPASSADGLSVV